MQLKVLYKKTYRCLSLFSGVVLTLLMSLWEPSPRWMLGVRTSHRYPQVLAGHIVMPVMGVSLSPQPWGQLVATCISFPVRACLLLLAFRIKFGSCRLPYPSAVIPERLSYFFWQWLWRGASPLSLALPKWTQHRKVTGTWPPGHQCHRWNDLSLRQSQTRPETLSCKLLAKPCASAEKNGIY